MSTSSDGGSTSSGMGGDMGAPNGTACVDGDACRSGLCADEVCCDAVCDGTCESCALSGAEGACTPQADGEDPENECGIASCNGASACQVASALWAMALGDGPDQSIASVQIDTKGDVYVAGTFTGSIAFDQDTTLSTAGADTDIFVAKYAATGSLIWARQYGNASNQSVTHMVVGPRVFIGGIYQGTATFTVASLPFSDRSSWYVAALNTGDGLGTWANGMADNQSSTFLNRNNLLAIAHTGSRFYTVTSYGSLLTDFEYTLRRYPVNGGTQEASAIVGGPVSYMTRTRDGGLLLGGSFSTGFNVLGGPSLSTSGGTDGWIARVSSGLTASWATSMGGSGAEVVRGLTELDNEELVAVGTHTADFTAGAATVMNAGQQDAFAVRLSSSGSVLDGVGFGGTGDDAFTAVAAGTDHVVITGTSNGPLDIGGPLNAGGGDDAVVVKLSASDLSVLWARRAGLLLDQTPRGVAVDGLDRIYVAGTLEMDMTLGGLMLESQGNQDGFIYQLTP